MKNLLRHIYTITGLIYAIGIEYTDKFKKTVMKSFKKFLQIIFESLNMFRVEGIIAVLGIVALVAWLLGVEEAFLGIGFTLHAIYTAFRLWDCTRMGKELEEKLKK